ncbi:multiple monosaccharide ABC transporter ATP-binding protein [Actinomyces sp. 432]|uniref:multiple monosaccharide ABC transporter ATP-binding protein n=1 Tax=Actinomyces sp. 432 TaxID=2057798 RepID=UPI0023510D0C|nr:multiple monosaccharide ABC transporter ATP-binding protein [Actinomyces sp. 432]
MRHITKPFGDFKALDDVNLEVRRGEILAICGENGAGKSTLMNVLSGVWPRGTYDGDIVYDGEVRQFRSIRDSEAVGIVIIHQELALSPYLSVAENIFMGNEKSRRGVIDWDATNEAAAELLREVGLNIRPQTRVADLGVGQQQLVEIAKALSKDVRLLILDEPTAALNDDDSAHLLDLMWGLRERGITMVMISHKLAEVAGVADRTTIIRDGRTVGTAPLHGEGTIGEDEIIRLMVGRELSSRFPEHTPHVGEEVLRIEHWTAHHPIDTARAVVDDAALSLRRGEIVGLAGLMGAGRTELAMSLFGRSWGTNISGLVYKDGKEISTATVRQAIDNGLAYVTEDRKVLGLNLIQDVKTNTTAAALNKVSSRGIVDDAAEEEVAERYRRELRTKTESLATPVGSLSGGNQQKVVLAKWMFSDPDVLILDEPTRGIDVGAKYEIYQIINQLADSGKAILVISSELPELLGICDRVYTMSQGRITGQMPRAEATQENLMKLMTIEKDAAGQGPAPSTEQEGAGQ